jgi:hypothetical protein
MGNRVSAPGACLFPDPAFWKTPARRQFWSVDQLKVRAIVLSLFSGLAR